MSLPFRGGYSRCPWIPPPPSPPALCRRNTSHMSEMTITIGFFSISTNASKQNPSQEEDYQSSPQEFFRPDALQSSRIDDGRVMLVKLPSLSPPFVSSRALYFLGLNNHIHTHRRDKNTDKNKIKNKIKIKIKIKKKIKIKIEIEIEIRIKQNRTEQNKTKQNRTEQNKTEQIQNKNKIEQNKTVINQPFSPLASLRFSCVLLSLSLLNPLLYIYPTTLPTYHHATPTTYRFLIKGVPFLATSLHPSHFTSILLFVNNRITSSSHLTPHTSYFISHTSYLVQHIPSHPSDSANSTYRFNYVHTHIDPSRPPDKPNQKPNARMQCVNKFIHPPTIQTPLEPRISKAASHARRHVVDRISSSENYLTIHVALVDANRNATVGFSNQ